MHLRITAYLSGLMLTTALLLPASAEVLISVDKGEQRMTVTVDGQTRYTWPVSTGVESYDTPSGAHRPFRMERTHFSREFDDAPMPNAIFFTGQGHAIHGTNHTRQLGNAASHGCVRLAPKNAATLFSLVNAQGMPNTRVVIEGDGPVMATRHKDGFKSARRKGYFGDGVMSAGMQMGRGTTGSSYDPFPARRAYRQPESYGVQYRYGDSYQDGRGDSLD
jgi:hypothetical protein